MQYLLIFYTLPDYDEHRFRAESRFAAIRLMNTILDDYDIIVDDFELFPIDLL